MLRIDIPGFGLLEIEHLVSDYTGTLSVDGLLLPGIREKLNKLSESMEIHVLTSDTFGKARAELKGINCEIHILDGENIDILKEEYIKKLGAEKVVAMGNGNNDRRMLKKARLGIAVIEGDGCAADALLAADIHVRNAHDALDILLNPKRFIATLRF